MPLEPSLETRQPMPPLEVLTGQTSLTGEDRLWGMLPHVLALASYALAGLSFIVCCAHTYYQDVEYVLGNLLQVGMFLTPVLYPASKLDLVAPVYRTLFMLNPMAVYTEGWRNILLRHAQEFPEPVFVAAAGGVSVAVFIVGLAVWRRYEWRFPEVI